ncbi:MAG: TetR/AcrR family transcriptional regulator [Oscillospiraceae bacterium]
MAVDMKETIAEAARRLIQEKKVKKLTVKDIVEECNITRQAFYYHFADIPELFQWVLERGTEQLLRDSRARQDPEEGLRYFFLLGINSAPYLKKSMQSNYGVELERLLTQHIYQLFEQIAKDNGLYRNCSPVELNIITRYHGQAIIGLLREWTEEDTKNLDQIVHTVYLLMTGGLSPFSSQ